MKPITLTKREYEVLVRLTKNAIDIADELCTSEANVRKVTANIFNKLNVNTKAAALIRAQRLELVALYNIHL